MPYVTRILTGEILEDNGDGTFVVDLDDDGIGVTVVRAPTVRVGEIGTVLDTEGAQVLIGPRIGDDQPSDALHGLGSFETWTEDTQTTSGLTPVGWNGFWSAMFPWPLEPYTPWVADGALSALLSISNLASQSSTLTLNDAIVAPAQSMNLRVQGIYKPIAAQAGNQVSVRVYWGTSDAMAMPLASGSKVTYAVVHTLTSATGEVAFDVTAPMPPGAYTYARVQLLLVSKAAAAYVAGSVAFDGVTAQWLDSGGTDTPWLDWTPEVHAGTTNPNPGTAASGMLKRGRYTRQGSTVRGWGRVDAGTSGVTVGSGEYNLSLPVAPRSGTPCHATVLLQDVSGSIRSGLAQKSLSAVELMKIYVPPVAFSANGDTTVNHTRFQMNNSGLWFIEWWFQYEAALPDPV